MAKKKKKESFSEFYKKVHSSNNDEYFEGGTVGNKEFKASISDINNYRQEQARQQQEEINNRSVSDWKRLRDEADFNLKSSQNALLNRLNENNINAKIQGKNAVAKINFENDLEIGKQKKFNANKLQENADNQVALFNYMNTDEGKELKQDIREKWDTRANYISGYESKKAEEDEKKLGVLSKLAMSPIQGAASMFSWTRGDLSTDEGQLPSYNEAFLQKTRENAENPLLRIGYGALGEYGKQKVTEALNRMIPGANIGTILYFGDIANDQYNSAIRRGYSDEAALNYAAASTGVEMIFERLLGAGSEYFVGSKGATQEGFELLVSKVLKNVLKSNTANKILSSTISEGFEEYVEEYLGNAVEQVTLNWADKGEKIDWNEIVGEEARKNAIESGIIGAITGAAGKTGEVLGTPKNVKTYEQAVYDIEKQTKRDLNTNDKILLENMMVVSEEMGRPLSKDELVQNYYNSKRAETAAFESSAVSQFSNLDENSRVLYNNLIQDVSEFINNTGQQVRFDENQQTVAEWEGNTLVLNPSLTDMPIKTLLLKELSTKSLDNNTKKYILSYMKKNGLYDTLKQELLDSGEFDEANVDNEIISRELNTIFEDQQKLEQLAKDNKNIVKELKNKVDSLANTVGNRQTKDGMYLKVLGDKLNLLDITKNNVVHSELKTENIEQKANKKSSEATKNQPNNLLQLDIDTTKFKGMGKKTLENIKNSGINLNNNQQAREFVNYLSQIGEDKNIEFNFINNNKIKEMGLNPKDASGKKLYFDGFNNNGVISINVDSKNALNVILGHEITHALEESQYYDDLQKAVFDYLGKDEVKNRLTELDDIYKNVKNADTKKELVSDIVGEKLFTDKKFIDSLTKNKNLFERVFDEIRYLWTKLFGTSEEKKMNEIYRDFVKAYNDKIAVKSDFSYSLSDITTIDKNKKLYNEPNLDYEYNKSISEDKLIDNNGNELSKGQYEKYKNAKTVDNEGRLIVGYHNTRRYSPFYTFKPGNVQGDNQFAIWATDSQIMGKTYSGEEYEKTNIPYSKKITSIKEANELLDKYSDGKYKINKESYEYLEKNRRYTYAQLEDRYKEIFEDPKNTLKAVEEDYKKGYITEEEYKFAQAMANKSDIYAIAKTDGSEFGLSDSDDKKIYYSKEDLLNNIRSFFKASENPGYTYPIYMNITNPYIVESDGRLWRRAQKEVDKGKVEEFKDIINSKEKIKKVNNLFDESRERYNNSYKKNSEISQVLDQLYYNSNDNYNMDSFVSHLTKSGIKAYDNYSDFRDDSYKLPPNDTKLSELVSIIDNDIFEQYKNYTVEEYFNLVKFYYENEYTDYVYDYFINNVEKELGLKNLKPEDVAILKDYTKFNNDEITDRFTYNYSTNQVVKKILESNQKGETNYDGVIFKNLLDPGEFADEDNLGKLKGNVYVMFNPNQMDFIDNENPTDNPDISYKLSRESENIDGYRVYGKDIVANPLVKAAKTTETTPKKQNKAEISTVKTEDGRKQRKAYTSVMKSPYQTEQAKQIAKKYLGLDTYIPDSNKNELERADAHIERYGVNDSLKMLRAATESTRNNVDDIAIGNRLIEYYSKIGDEAGLTEAMQLTAMAGTNLGRAVQAISLINRLTPTGQATWVQKSIDQMNKKLKDAYDKSKSPFKKLQQFNFTNEMKQKIINSNESNLEQNLNEVYSELGNQVQMSAMEALDTWRYFAMLSSPTTHIRNIVGNLMMGKMQDIKNVIKGGIEDIYYNATGKEGERTATYKKASKKYYDYARKDINNVKGQLGLGDNKYTNPKTQLQQNMRMFGNGKLGKLLEKYIKKGAIDLTSKALELEDIWGLKAAYTKSMAQYLYANKIDINKITDSQLARARQFAIDQAKQATFHQDNAIATALNTIENQNLITKIAVGGIDPFKKTPLNIATTSLEYNPVGLIKSLTIDSAKLYNGKITANQWIDNISKGLTGTGIAILGCALAQAGFIKTSGDDDDDYDQDRGLQPYSIVLGDKTISLDWLSPTAVPLFVGAELQKQFDNMNNEMTEEDKYKNAKDSILRLLDAGVSSLNPVSEMTMLSGIQSALRSYSKDYSKALEQIGVNTVKNYVSQIIPSILGKTARVFDDKERATTSTKKSTVEKAIDTFKNQAISKIPIARNFLPVKTDVWGNEIEQSKNILVRAAYNYLSPATIKNVRENELDKEINRLYDSTGESKVLPKTYITKELTYDNKNYRLTDREYQAYKKELGKSNYEDLTRIINTNEYKKLSDTQKADVINKIYSYNRDAMKVGYAKVHNISYDDTYYQTEKELESLGGNVGDYYLFKSQIPEKTSSYDKWNILKNMSLDKTSKSQIYEATVSGDIKTATYKVLKDYDVDIDNYLDYLSKEFKADKDKDGNSISGTKKTKVFNYMNKSDLSYYQKLLILGDEYALTPNQKTEIFNLINNSSLSKDEKLTLYKGLTGFKVTSDGTVRW